MYAGYATVKEKEEPNCSSELNEANHVRCQNLTRCDAVWRVGQISPTERSSKQQLSTTDGRVTGEAKRQLPPVNRVVYVNVCELNVVRELKLASAMWVTTIVV